MQFAGYGAVDGDGDGDGDPCPLSAMELLFTSAPPKCYNVVLLEFGFLLSPALLAKSALAQRH